MSKELRKNGGKKVRFEDLCTLSLKHKGKCYRKGKNAPASAEEPQAAEIGRGLLLNKEGQYRGDDVAVFAQRIHSDNDTRAPLKMIRTQNEIVGPAADDISEHQPDLGHTLKNVSGELYGICDKDSSFQGKGLLENGRILTIMADTCRGISQYHPFLGDTDKRTECLKNIGNTIAHHCGNYSDCTNPTMCSFLEVKTKHPTWGEEEINAEVVKTSFCHGGTYIDLSEEGSDRLKKVLTKRFNSEIIDWIAKMACSNSCKGFWGMATKYSEGKCLNLDQTDYWFSILEYCFCRSGGNIERTMIELSDELGLTVTPMEHEAMARHQRKREYDRKLNNSDAGKLRRQQAKIFKYVKMGKENAKK